GADAACEGFDCGPGCTCHGMIRIETACGDGVDNDGDNLKDCQDPDCATVPPCGSSGTGGGSAGTGGGGSSSTGGGSSGTGGGGSSGAGGGASGTGGRTAGRRTAGGGAAGGG